MLWQGFDYMIKNLNIFLSFPKKIQEQKTNSLIKRWNNCSLNYYVKFPDSFNLIWG